MPPAARPPRQSALVVGERRRDRAEGRFKRRDAFIKANEDVSESAVHPLAKADEALCNAPHVVL